MDGGAGPRGGGLPRGVLEWAKSWIGSDFTADGFPSKRNLYAEKFDWSDYALNIHATNFDELFDHFLPFMRASDNDFEMLDYAGGRSGGSTRWIWRAKHHANLPGLPLAGKNTEVPGVSHVVFDAQGKLVVVKDYWSLATLLTQIGVLALPQQG
jgi:steroid delta-isomerase-like uncharacterized protein